MPKEHKTRDDYLHKRSVTWSAKSVPITTKPNADGETLPAALSTGGLCFTTGSRRKRAARRAEKNGKDIRVLSLGEYIPSSLGAPPVTYAALEDLGRNEPLAASLTSVVARSVCFSSSSAVVPTE